MDHGFQEFGLSAALATPFGSDGRIDGHALVQHAKRCLAGGCDSVTLFGTTGEGASIGMRERAPVLEAFSAARIAGNQLIVGIAAATVEDAVAQINQASRAQCRAVLLPPPFYFKDVSDDGLFDWFSAVLGQLPDDAPDVILYTIPSQTGVGLSTDLIARLRTAFGSRILGVKDSTCEWDHTEALLDAHRDLIILVGDERLLARAVKLGAKGSICGVANVFPGELKELIQSANDDPAINEFVDALVDYPIVAAIKSAIAHKFDEPVWYTMRPPLDKLDAGRASQLKSSLAQHGIGTAD